MTGGDIALVATTSSIGYLVVGWIVFVVCAALFDAHDDGYSNVLPRHAQSMWGFMAIFWPVMAPVLLVLGFVWFCKLVYGRGGMWAIRKLNPQKELWR